MTDAEKRQPEKARLEKSGRESLLSAQQAGWALSFATVVALGLGVWMVGKLVSGLGGGAAPPIEINQATQPVAAPSPQFQILEPDSAPSSSGRKTDAARHEWVESLFLRESADYDVAGNPVDEPNRR